MTNFMETKQNNYPFTVLLSVYDKENPRFLDLALKSILVNQTMKPDEVVLVLDGPINDNLMKVIDMYKNEHSVLKIHPIDSNVGLGKALNFGLQKCSNEIIIRADSDDICMLNRFEIQVNYLINNPYVDIVGSNILEFENDEKIVKNYKIMPENHEKIIKMAQFRNPINHMTVGFRKSKIIEIDSYMDLPFLEDYYLWIRAIIQGYIIHNIQEYLVLVRIGNGMVKRRGNKKYISSWKEMNKFMRKKKFITSIQYARNIIAIYLFIYMPVGIRKFLYKSVLRKSKRSNLDSSKVK